MTDHREDELEDLVDPQDDDAELDSSPADDSDADADSSPQDHATAKSMLVDNLADVLSGTSTPDEEPEAEESEPEVESPDEVPEEENEGSEEDTEGSESESEEEDPEEDPKSDRRRPGAEDRIKQLVREKKDLERKSLYKAKLDEALAEQKIAPENWDWWVQTGFKFNQDPIGTLAPIIQNLGLELADPRNRPTPTIEEAKLAEIRTLVDNMASSEEVIRAIKAAVTPAAPQAQPTPQPTPRTQAPTTQIQGQEQFQAPSLAKEDEMLRDHLMDKGAKFAKRISLRHGEDTWKSIAEKIKPKLDRVALEDWYEELERLTNEELKARTKTKRPPKKQQKRQLHSTSHGAKKHVSYEDSKEDLVGRLDKLLQ